MGRAISEPVELKYVQFCLLNPLGVVEFDS
jgi:hypothetical protein